MFTFISMYRSRPKHIIKLLSLGVQLSNYRLL